MLVCSTEYQNWRHGHCYSHLVDCGIVNLVPSFDLGFV